MKGCRGKKGDRLQSRGANAIVVSGCKLAMVMIVVASSGDFMEIDLNHAVIEVEKNACGNGDCDKGGGGGGGGWGDGCCLSSSTSSSSSNSSSSLASSSIYMELWHACAGPLSTLPKKGNVVVYFPQGHLEQAVSSSPFPPMEVTNFDLQPQIFCRVMDVQLLANKENDEVYTQLTLLPLPEVYACPLVLLLSLSILGFGPIVKLDVSFLIARI
ncbi:hypothetical protein TEA_012801 [Camellia sinensis var. sinensis]|uniref:Auxin response factor domain-containing protein n=1 Tax=Camellia sinensis var. sinensis TaxID=542762 RepID=A0A4S4F179_CAMSN|nr:hypothetical protein TEA_012801 [Camellia sinensis var. sinensis]